VDDSVVVAFHFRARMDRTRVGEITALVGRTALDAHATPGRLKCLLQAGVAVGHDEQRRPQPSFLKIGQEAAPRSGCFTGGQLQRHEPFLASFRNTERREDRSGHDAFRQANLEMEPIEYEHRVSFAAQIARLPCREERLQAGHNPGHRALRQMAIT
jgi:hypothetical protein